MVYHFTVPLTELYETRSQNDLRMQSECNVVSGKKVGLYNNCRGVVHDVAFLNEEGTEFVLYDRSTQQNVIVYGVS